MTITYPYATTFLADRLKIRSVRWDTRRNDEISGDGDGRTWQAELAPPLWTAEVSFAAMYGNEAKQIAALIRKLHGAQEAFFLYDPQSLYPQYDPTGSILGSNTVRIDSIPVGNQSLTLKGLPANYTLTIGDKLQITYASSPNRNYFAEVSETITANGSGVTGAFEVFPAVPAGVSIDDIVVLKKPACKGFIVPESFNPGTVTGTESLRINSDGAFKFMERRR